MINNCAEPHWYCGDKGEAPAEGDTNLDPLVAAAPSRRDGVGYDGKVLKFQTEQTVQVDEDKVVDGGAEQNSFHRGHHVTHYWTKSPPGNIFIKIRNLR